MIGEAEPASELGVRLSVRTEAAYLSSKGRSISYSLVMNLTTLRCDVVGQFDRAKTSLFFWGIRRLGRLPCKAGVCSSIKRIMIFYCLFSESRISPFRPCPSRSGFHVRSNWSPARRARGIAGGRAFGDFTAIFPLDRIKPGLEASVQETPLRARNAAVRTSAAHQQK